MSGKKPVWGASLLRAMGSLLSPAGRRGRLLILFYHRVHAQPDPMRPDDVDAAAFEWQMQVLKQVFNVLPLPEAVHRLRQGDLPANAVCVTFDDGYADNVEVALPILKRCEVPAAFFLTTGFFGQGRMWNDTIIEALRMAPGSRVDLNTLGLGEYDVSTEAKRCQAAGQLLRKLKYLPRQEREQAVSRVLEVLGVEPADRPMMTTEQVQALAGSGMDIGAHTVYHPILNRISDEEAREEIVAGKRRLEEILSTEVRLFAYPNGVPHEDYEVAHVNIIREAGFDAAFSTAWGIAEQGADFYQLPRIAPWDKTPLRFCLRLLRSYTDRAYQQV